MRFMVQTDVHAFLAWFDVSFECTHTKVRFSTGPHAKYTHWKYVSAPPFLRVVLLTGSMLSIRQTVFYTPDTLTVSEGEQITGRLSCAPNARNPRDLDITIAYRTPHDTQETEIHYKMCVCFLFFFRIVSGLGSWTNADGLSGHDDRTPLSNSFITLTTMFDTQFALWLCFRIWTLAIQHGDTWAFGTYRY